MTEQILRRVLSHAASTLELSPQFDQPLLLIRALRRQQIRKSRMRVLQGLSVTALVVVLTGITIAATPKGEAMAQEAIKGMTRLWAGLIGKAEVDLQKVDAYPGESVLPNSVASLEEATTRVGFRPAEVHLEGSVLEKVEVVSHEGDDGRLTRSVALRYRVKGDTVTVSTTAYYNKENAQWVMAPFAPETITYLTTDESQNARAVNLGKVQAFCFESLPTANALTNTNCHWWRNGLQHQAWGEDPGLVEKAAQSTLR